MRPTSNTLARPTLRRFAWIAVALAPLGCASQQQLLEAETDTKARMAKLEAGLAAEKARVDKLTTDLAAVRATSTEATRIGTEATKIGTDARQRADAAAAQGEAVDARLAKALANRFARVAVQEFRVEFETGRAELPGGTEEILQAASKLLTDNATYSVDVIGLTDDVGTAGSNVNLSWRREEMVRRFMVERGVPLNRFSFIGLGEDRATGTSSAVRTRERHVSIVVYRPAD
jgi:outer membrane protein OmpA-like peptidoglycan-associated protein